MISESEWHSKKEEILSILRYIDVSFLPSTSSGKNWTNAVTGSSSGWHDLCYSDDLGLFVAVSAFGGQKVMTSPDGETWTVRSAPDQDWRNVCWSKELGIFVAVAKSGSSGRVMTSPDGVNWTLRSSPLNDFHGVCWSPEVGIFVAVAQSGSGNRVMTSPDGVNWTSRTSTSDNVWQTVTWAKGLGVFVSVAEVGSGDRCMTSPDGINWTPKSCPVHSWKYVTWAEKQSLLVAVSYDGNVMTSPDAVNWTLGSCPSSAWHHVCYGGGVLVAMGENSGPKVMRSEDGIQWQEIMADDEPWQASAWSDSQDKFVAVGLGGSAMFSGSSVDESGENGAGSGGIQDPSQFSFGSSATVSGSGVSWAGVDSVLSDSGYATCQMTGQGNTSSSVLTVSGFGLNISTPSTVEISIEKSEDSGTNPNSVLDSYVSVGGESYSDTDVWGGSDRVFVYTFNNVTSDPVVSISAYRSNGSIAKIKSVKARVV